MVSAGDASEAPRPAGDGPRRLIVSELQTGAEDDPSTGDAAGDVPAHRDLSHTLIQRRAFVGEDYDPAHERPSGGFPVDTDDLSFHKEKWAERQCSRGKIWNQIGPVGVFYDSLGREVRLIHRTNRFRISGRGDRGG